jgi:hypothetical protein
MTDPKSPSDPRDQEQAVVRRPHPEDPTHVENERVSDASTINSGGLGGGRPDGGATVTPERARYEEQDEIEPNVRGGADVPRAERARTGDDDPVMPADDATLNTKI